MILAVVGGDGLPCSITYYSLVSGSESYTLVAAQHIGSTEDLHNCLVLFSSREQNSLDSELWWSYDANAVQQFPQSAGGNQGFISIGLDLIHDVVLFLLLEIAQRSVVLIIFILLLVAFFLLLILFLLMVVVVVVILQ
jgi:type IV secretory pathway VirB6-like protein